MKIISRLLFLSFLLTNSSFAESAKTTVGVNLWQALLWALPEESGGNRNRLHRELQFLHHNGFQLVRIMASVQGSMDPEISSKGRVQPSCETHPGKWSKECQQALDYLLWALEKYQLQAILVLGNFWHWSGGFAQYLAWAEDKEEIPFAFDSSSSFWEIKSFFQNTASFYKNARAKQYYLDFLKKVVTRKNLLKNNQSYAHDPAIACWQLANEPTPYGSDNFEALLEWAKEATTLFRQLAPRACLSLGGVGTGPLPFLTYTDLQRLYGEVRFDWMTIHLWPQNWGWYYPKPELAAKISWPIMKFLSAWYLRYHITQAKRLGIPIVLEEVGLARDAESLSPSTSTERRDSFFAFVMRTLKEESIKQNVSLKGILFWAWGGEQHPIPGESQWKRGQMLVGDPPQEPQGWYSIYQSDHSTLEKINATQ